VNVPGPEEVLLDTDVLSFFNRDPVRIPRNVAHLRGRVLYASFVSAAEMRFGAHLGGWGPRRRERPDRFLRQYNTAAVRR
jgi:hypothetical protein